MNEWVTGCYKGFRAVHMSSFGRDECCGFGTRRICKLILRVVKFFGSDLVEVQG